MPGFLKGDYERRVRRASPAHTESFRGVPATSLEEVAGQKFSALLNMSPMSPRDGAKSGVLALWRKATVVPGFPNNRDHLSFTGPGFADIDLSGEKDTKVLEGLTFILRADAFDILNHSNFGQPPGNVQSSTFGQIS
jgi:hypothetical protein